MHVHFRTDLRRKTRAVHHALHLHPVLCALTHPEVSEAQYRRALRVFKTFYDAVEEERRRLNAWMLLTVATECEALALDLDAFETERCRLRFRNADTLLGGLYVAYGAAYGRAQFNANVRQAIPKAPRQFLSLSFPVARWKALLTCLEERSIACQARADVLTGAFHAFRVISRIADTAAQGNDF